MKSKFNLNQEIEEKTKVMKGLEERLRRQEREHQKLKSSRTQEYEALENKSRKLENTLKLSIAEQAEHEK